ncbi:MAG: hypothetical protein A2Y23_13495 [Clostridiales bacterium GWB2_37_7]|nr:MAG: hypothetical protein A2Y23_13495 [Clostridiales bacterium GWB2_37_7]
MVKEQINNGNARINSFGSNLEIEIPAKKNVFLLFFMIAWLGGWAFGEAFAVRELLTGNFSGGSAFLLFWLAGWTIGGGFAIFIVTWMIFGKEVICINNGFLTIEKRVLLFNKRKEYELLHVKSMRAIEKENMGIFAKRNTMEFYGMSGGTILFDYGMKTISFGINIDFAEAKYLIADILEPAISGYSRS